MLLEKLLITFALIIVIVVIAFIIIANKRIIEKIKILILKMLIAFHKDEEARKYALKSVDTYPKSFIAHKLLAEIYEKEGKLNIALDEYIRAADLNENELGIHYKVAELLNKTEKNDEAIIMLQDLLKIKPDYTEASKLLGNILYDEERFKESISVLYEALKYNPIDYDLYYSIGMAFTRLNDFQKAKEFYEKAATLNTYLYNGQYNLALIAMIQGELDEAEDYFEQALQQEDIESVAYFYLAQIAMLKGNKDKAITYLNIALELDKEDIENRIKEQPLFIEIQEKLVIPNESRKIKITLSKREQQNNKHLEEMFSLVDSLHGSAVSGGGQINNQEQNIDMENNEQENNLEAEETNAEENEQETEQESQQEQENEKEIE